MNRIRLLSIGVVLPLALAAGACSKRDAGRLAAPEPPAPEPPAAAEARWIWDKDELSAAVSLAASSPLVQRALGETPAPEGLTPCHEYAVRVVGTTSDGRTLWITFLPYIFGADSTHALYVSVIEDAWSQVAEPAEVILGRDPSPLEVGFKPHPWGTQTIWIKSGVAYSVKPASGNLAPEKFRWLDFLDCLVDRAPSACGAGAAVGGGIGGIGGPAGVAKGAAIGCGVGAAITAVACAMASR